MKAHYPRAELPAMLERTHAAIKHVEARIVTLEHEQAALRQQYDDANAKRSWLAAHWSPPPGVDAVRLGHLPYEIEARRNRRELLNTIRVLIEYALGTQADAITLTHDELRMLGMYGQGEEYEDA